MKRIALVALLVLCGCATPLELDKPTQDGVGFGLATAIVLTATVPIATPLWVVPIGGAFSGMAVRDYEREHP